ncbi:diguanylate cyclase [Psychromonas sp. 14N.309.X.WAT.B.A12]|uniref:diguanylate cyclase n=1 Tax=Psychromonas sp. 14N.309.X.WAT.B.A12 TaxID=2998322 RepID=UPI0025B24B0D|nr:diguanylate cyclase [Psychromonas sp. 14N.309.X.WAT.B.A12]MDN2663872.1 diguanylate cyclase [Psychromonas sp. 14N.309.X.WAT.B.A12]
MEQDEGNITKRINCLTPLCSIIIFILAILSAISSYYLFSQQHRETTISAASNEGGLVIKLSHGFVRAYSDFEAQYASGLLPNPALFRAHALKLTDLNSLFGGSLASEVVGFPGKAVRLEPKDDLMREQMTALQTHKDKKMKTSLFIRDGQTILRSVWPFYAKDSTCVNCHNKILGLTGSEQWKVGDLMGAQVVEKNIQQQLKDVSNEALLLSILIFLTVITVLYCFIFIRHQILLAKQLKTLANTDPMTGCMNRRNMYNKINNIEENVSGAILILDIDKFKKVNDNYGHAAGDVVIQTIAKCIKSEVRDSDWTARIGGEEFLIWLHNVSKTQAENIAESIRQQIESVVIEYQQKTIQCTASIGLYAFEDDSPTHFNTWFSNADALLYEAKSNGRNKVVS